MIVLLSTITIATTLVACQNTQAQTQEAATSQVQAQQSPPAKPGGEGFGGSDQVTQGEAATNLTTDATVTGETYESTGDDENALRVTGETVTLDGVTINKTAGATSNTENGDFYGMNAGFLATDGATVTITNAKRLKTGTECSVTDQEQPSMYQIQPSQQQKITQVVSKLLVALR